MNDIAVLIGRRIRARRELLQMTQEQLAVLVGVEQTTVSKWETGETCPSRRNERALVKALNAQGTGMFDVAAAA